MKLLSKIKAFFLGDPKEREKVEQSLENKGIGKWDCAWCELPIKEGEQKSFNQRKWHKKCYRQMFKMARKDLGV